MSYPIGESKLKEVNGHVVIEQMALEWTTEPPKAIGIYFVIFKHTVKFNKKITKDNIDVGRTAFYKYGQYPEEMGFALAGADYLYELSAVAWWLGPILEPDVPSVFKAEAS